MSTSGAATPGRWSSTLPRFRQEPNENVAYTLPMLPELEHWSLSKVAANRAPEERQPEVV